MPEQKEASNRRYNRCDQLVDCIKSALDYRSCPSGSSGCCKGCHLPCPRQHENGKQKKQFLLLFQNSRRFFFCSSFVPFCFTFICLFSFSFFHLSFNHHPCQTSQTGFRISSAATSGITVKNASPTSGKNILPRCPCCSASAQDPCQNSDQCQNFYFASYFFSYDFLLCTVFSVICTSTACGSICFLFLMFLASSACRFRISRFKTSSTAFWQALLPSEKQSSVVS